MAPQADRTSLRPEFAAHKIQRVWRRARVPLLDRANLRQRLQLESDLLIGFVRLVLFGGAFLTLTTVTSVGVPRIAQLEVSNVVHQQLNLDGFKGLKTLEDLRSFIPLVSERVKIFSVSGAQRFSGTRPHIEIVKERIQLAAPLVLTGLDLPIDGKSFSISAWIENVEGVKSVPLIRKPDPKNSMLSCWAWLHNPGELRYGSHDYRDPANGHHERVLAEGEERAGLSHESVVVDDGFVTFFSNGTPRGPTVKLPRPLTDCDSEILSVGGPGIALSAVKWYSRALTTAEIREMYFGGQPLTELATATVLPTFESDSFVQISGKVESEAGGTRDTVDRHDVAAKAQSVVLRAQLKEPENALLPIIFPEDHAPPATLYGGQAMFHTLLPQDRAAWIEGGNRTQPPILNQWRSDPIYGSFLQVFQDPIFVNRNGPRKLTQLPGSFPPNMTGFTISMWVNCRLLLDDETGDLYPAVTLTLHDDGPKRVSSANPFTATYNEKVLAVAFVGHYMQKFIIREEWIPTPTPENPTQGYFDLRVWEGNCAFEETRNSDGNLDESFVFANTWSAAEPMVWRWTTMTVDWRDLYNRKTRVYIDGKKISDSEMESNCPMGATPTRVGFDVPPHDFLANLFVSLDHITGTRTASTDDSRVKVADLRVWPRVLSDTEIEGLHLTDTWEGSGKAKRQCVDEKIDNDFVDSIKTDPFNLNCAWYSEHKGAHPEICESKEAKERCQVTCRGKRRCQNGARLADTPQRGVYRLFDRQLHLKPHQNTTQILCPSSRFDKEEYVSRCHTFFRNEFEKMDQSGTYRYEPEGYWFTQYDTLRSYIWADAGKLDMLNCSKVEASIVEEQCRFSTSTLNEFWHEYNQSKQYSISFWAKAKEGSFREPFPDNFVFLTSFFTTVLPPKYLFEMGPFNPKAFDDYILCYNLGFKEMRFTDPDLYFPVATGPSVEKITCCTDFSNSWTFIHLSVQELNPDDLTARVCLTLNNMPPQCRLFPIDPLEEHVMDALVFTHELLITPIELRAFIPSATEIQQMYYQQRSKMETMSGPSKTEADRVAQTEDLEVKDGDTFDEQLVLVAPPLIYQTRRARSECSDSSTLPVLDKHKKLIETVHCPAEVHCQSTDGERFIKNNSAGVFSCRGHEDSRTYFGLEPSTNYTNSPTYRDFLGTHADNPLVVRDGIVRQTRKFIDGQTERAEILILLMSPRDGQLHVVQLNAFLDGLEVRGEVLIQHYSHLNGEQRVVAQSLWTSFFVLCVLIVLLNIKQFFEQRAAAQENGRWSRKVVFDIAYDICQVVVLLVFAIQAWGEAMSSEDRSIGRIEDLTAVPWSSPDIKLIEKMATFSKAINDLQEELASAENQNIVGFIIMILMLVRILKATEVHPRTGLLTGTFWHGLNDLWHFSILFCLVFIFAATVSTWSFGSFREDFKDLQTSMQTQFKILMGDLPDDFDEDLLMIFFIVISVIIQFFLMLNFLLALVVEAYGKVRKDIEMIEVEKELVTDLITTVEHCVLSLLQGWPRTSYLIHILNSSISSRNINAEHLRLAGVPPAAARRIVAAYARHQALWSKDEVESVYDLALRSRGVAKAMDKLRRVTKQDVVSTGPQQASSSTNQAHSATNGVPQLPSVQEPPVNGGTNGLSELPWWEGAPGHLRLEHRWQSGLPSNERGAEEWRQLGNDNEGDTRPFKDFIPDAHNKPVTEHQVPQTSLFHPQNSTTQQKQTAGTSPGTSSAPNPVTPSTPPAPHAPSPPSQPPGAAQPFSPAASNSNSAFQQGWPVAAPMHSAPQQPPHSLHPEWTEPPLDQKPVYASQPPAPYWA